MCSTALSVLILSPVTALAAPPLTSVPLGVSDLLSEVVPEIGYQYFDREASSLGVGWTGFDPATGVYFVPEQTSGGAAQVFMHCPWIGGTGIAFADYRLKLPSTSRIRLAFEIGLRAGATGSDGVTYRVRAGERAVFEQHCTWREFRPFEADLTAFAGSEVHLRLEVDPGPQRNSTEDWSLWRKVTVLAGTAEQIAAARARLEAEAQRQRAADIRRGGRLAEASLLPVTSSQSDSVCPSALEPTELSVQAQGDAYVFRCAGPDETVSYRLDPEAGLLGGLTVTVNAMELSPAPFDGGPRIVLDGREFAIPTRLLRTELVAARLDGLRLTCEYRYVNPETGSSAALEADLWPEGKSLGVEVKGERDRFSGFTARPFGGRSVPTAFAVGGSPVWRKEGVYVATVADLMRSEASGVGADSVTYTPLTDGRRNAMHDHFHLTVTSRYEEALSNLTHQPSPFLEELAGRVVLDAWGGSFAENGTWLTGMAAYGIDGFLTIKHVWQRDGYDHSYPNTMPANAAMGGDEALRSLSLTAQQLGHRFNVHENYYDYYPNAEAFREADCALNAQGQTIPGWDNGSVRAVILKPSKLMDYAREFSPQIKERYDCNSAYHDIMPTWHVDYDAAVPDAGKIRVTHEHTRQLCDYDRQLFGGPVVFEAADPHMAGVYDGGCNHGVDTYQTPVAVAYELLKVHPRMSNHGFGYYERWLPWGYGAGWSSYVMTDRELDKYRAYQIAFGRTGFVGQQLMKHPHAVVREYHLMQAFARAYTGRRVEHLRYEIDGKLVDAGTAARYGALDRLRIDYEGGQRVYVNLAAEPWKIDGLTLPPNGAATDGPRAQARWSIQDGQICDFARYGDVTYADARSHVWLPPTPPAPIEPSVAELKPVGGKEFELTVNWKVGRKPERDYTVFWHFKREGEILFQADHAPPRPATTWSVGGTVVDGPRRLAVPDDPDVTQYDIVVGLYDSKGRAPLVNNADQMLIGRLMATREGAVATTVTGEPVEPRLPPGTDPAPYLEAANTSGRVIDFGDVATNGAVVMRQVAEGWEVVPVPIGDVFTVELQGRITEVKAYGRDGAPLPAPALSRRGDHTSFETSAEAARYVAALR